MIIRQGQTRDAEGISTFLQALVRVGKRTLPADVDFVRGTYLNGRDLIRCSVAEAPNGTLVGIQILFLAVEGNPYGTPVGWGTIGTHVSPDAGRQGIGRALFDATQAAARTAGLTWISAAIGAQNAEGLAYYSKMGFETYDQDETRIFKRFACQRAAS